MQGTGGGEGGRCQGGPWGQGEEGLLMGPPSAHLGFGARMWVSLGDQSAWASGPLASSPPGSPLGPARASLCMCFTRGGLSPAPPPLTQSLAKGVVGGRSDSAQCQAGITARAGVKVGVSLPQSRALGGRHDPLLCPQPQRQPQMRVWAPGKSCPILLSVTAK